MNELNLFLVLILKPAVIVLGSILLKPLWKMREKPGLRFIFWSTVVFMVGELLCGVDVYGCRRMTPLNEGLHDIAMMMSFSGYVFGIFTIYSHKRSCFKIGCPQYRDCLLETKDCEPSGQYGPVTLTLILTGIVLATMPMLSSPVIHQTLIEAGFRDKVVGNYLYDRTFELYLLQQIVFPGVSIIAFLVTMSVIIIQGKISPLAYKTASLGLGALSFVYFRVVLINLFHPHVIFTNVGEEIIELLFMLLLVFWLLPSYKSWNSVKEAILG